MVGGIYVHSLGTSRHDPVPLLRLLPREQAPALAHVAQVRPMCTVPALEVHCVVMSEGNFVVQINPRVALFLPMGEHAPTTCVPVLNTSQFF